MLIMVTCWIPPDKSAEAAKKFVEVMQKIPFERFEKPLLMLGGRPVKDGIKAISIGEVEKGKYEEAVSIVWRRMIEFDDIKGFRYEIEPLLTAEEALPMIGLTPPK